MKTIAALLCLFLLLAEDSRADSTPSAELQIRCLKELDLTFVPRNLLREGPGWHFKFAKFDSGKIKLMDVYVPEGSTFDQIKTLFNALAAKHQQEHASTPAPTP
jgi:hypothetical protein